MRPNGGKRHIPPPSHDARSRSPRCNAACALDNGATGARPAAGHPLFCCVLCDPRRNEPGWSVAAERRDITRPKNTRYIHGIIIDAHPRQPPRIHVGVASGWEWGPCAWWGPTNRGPGPDCVGGAIATSAPGGAGLQPFPRATFGSTASRFAFRRGHTMAAASRQAGWCADWIRKSRSLPGPECAGLLQAGSR